MISFVLFPQASQLSMDFNILSALKGGEVDCEDL